jgi:hypothetical protein
MLTAAVVVNADSLQLWTIEPETGGTGRRRRLVARLACGNGQRGGRRRLLEEMENEGRGESWGVFV